MSKSRTYRILMSWLSDPDPLPIESNTRYSVAIMFLDDLQRAWKGRGLEVNRVAHNSLNIGNRLYVWFEEEKNDTQQMEGQMGSQESQ